MSLFDLPQAPSVLQSGGVVGSNYVKIEPTQAIRTDATFASSRIQYRLNVPDGHWLRLDESYLRIRVRLTARTGGGAAVSITSATAANKTVTPALGMPARLFQTAEYLIGGQVVSRINNNMAQVDSMKKRTENSGDWLREFGSATGMYHPSDIARQFTFAGVTAPDTDGYQEYELCWQPPLGIWGVGHAMPSGGAHILNLTANTNFLKQVVTSVGAAGELTPGVDYDFNVSSCVLYISTIEGPSAPEETKYVLSFPELQCQGLALTSNTTGMQAINFDLPAKSSTLALAFQGSDNENRYGGYGSFKIGNQDELKLRRFYLQYKNAIKPMEQSESEWSDAANLFNQRYLQTLEEAGRLSYTGGQSTEKFSEWIESGAYYLFRWPTSGISLSNRAQVNFELNTAATATALLFSWAPVAYLVSTVSGRVAQVQTE